jgi:glycosyltransferase involved in cell wall biosynthesis
MKTKREKKILPPVTVVLPMRNASSTVIKALESIRFQTYPISEVILVDNVSSDNSVEVVKKFAKRNPRMNIKVIENKKDLMVAGSYNIGIKAAKTSFVALVQSDCCYTSSTALATLVDPLLKDSEIVATYGFVENPLSVWKKYSFWEKCLLANDSGRIASGLVGKVDCYRRDVLLSIKGFDSKRYIYGGEDADLHIRLRKKGKVIGTKAKSYHLHYLYSDFSLLDLIKKKQMTARSYGRVLRVRGTQIGIMGIISHLFKPVLAIGSLVPVTRTIILPLLIIFPFLYYRRIFWTPITFLDPRILLLPFVAIFLVYFETIYIFEAFFKPIERNKFV